MPTIDPEDREAIYTIAGAIVLLAGALYLLDTAGFKFNIGVTN